MELGKGLEQQERLRELEGLSLEKRGLRGGGLVFLTGRRMLCSNGEELGDSSQNTASKPASALGFWSNTVSVGMSEPMRLGMATYQAKTGPAQSDLSSAAPSVQHRLTTTTMGTLKSQSVSQGPETKFGPNLLQLKSQSFRALESLNPFLLVLSLQFLMKVKLELTRTIIPNCNVLLTSYSEMLQCVDRELGLQFLNIQEEFGYGMVLSCSIHNHSLEKPSKILESNLCLNPTMSLSATSRPFLDTSRDGDSTISLGSPCQCLTVLSRKKFLLMSNLNHSCLTSQVISGAPHMAPPSSDAPPLGDTSKDLEANSRFVFSGFGQQEGELYPIWVVYPKCLWDVQAQTEGLIF
ncbi:hypothetical protein BTVI_140557 [Pitangus sulphuratus]|nr:hypothetical protein BTVI_140557 [Pitangus sulphuratus]